MEKPKRQYVNYLFYKALPEWRRLDPEARQMSKREFAEVLQAWNTRMILRTYSTVGMRPDTDLMLWRVAESLEQLRQMTTEISACRLGPYLSTPYSYLAMTKHSMYVDQHQHEGQEGARLRVVPGKAKYLFVYPFVKTRDWYLLPKEERQRMMDQHIAMGHRYPTVKINTSYSFGLDDQEFVVAFESDRPDHFLDLVMELREADASRYTLRDTPIFTCIAMGIPEMLDALGG